MKKIYELPEDILDFLKKKRDKTKGEK